MFNSILLEINRNFLFQIISGFLALIVGFSIGKIVQKMVSNFLNKIRLNHLVERLGWTEAFSRVGIKLSTVRFFAEISKWLVFILFLMFAVEIWGFGQFSQFLGKIVSYFPNVLIASLIFIATLFFG